MKASALVLLVVVLVVFTLAAVRFRQLAWPAGNGAETVAAPFVTPLGVIPLIDDKPARPPLRNGYVKEKARFPKYTTEYYVSLSADRIGDFVRSYVQTVLPESGYAI